MASRKKKATSKKATTRRPTSKPSGRASRSRAKKAAELAAAKRHQAALKQRRERALQKRDPKAFAKLQKQRLDRNKRRREQYAAKKVAKKIRATRDRLLGPVATGEGPHGMNRDDWMSLRAMQRARSREWIEFLAEAQAEGWSDHEAADEWYSPEM